MALDMSPAAIAARLAAAPANGSAYTYQDYLAAGNGSEGGQDDQQGNNNFATAALSGNQQYQALLAQAKAGDVQAQQALPGLQQQILTQAGMPQGAAQLNNSDPTAANYGLGQDVGMPTWMKVAMGLTVGLPLAGAGIAALAGGGADAAAGGGAAAAGGGGSAAAGGATTAGALGGGTVGGAMIPGGSALAAGGGVGATTAGATAAGATAAGASGLPSWLMPALQTGAGLFSGYEQGQQAANAQKITQGGQAIQATQLNPYAQLQDSQKQALASALLANYRPMTYTPGTQSSGPNPTMTSAGTFNGGVGGALSNPLFQAQIAPFFSQGAQQSADQNFQSTVAGANPLYQNPFTTQGAQALGFGGGSTPAPGSPGSINLQGPTPGPGSTGPQGSPGALGSPTPGSPSQPNSNLALLSNSLIPKPTNYLPLGGS